ncbi:hypothetical protein CEUSTIGMA_g8510.t1 [Chlamydomonas eustigma]|uniref:Methyltransferase FkbM domain-containing protein n=2 Tax=Chlamydomonas eustigma TaxID=1157962 RepID=A0A250XDC5_9CHLO|nr:hypothetical protein CEUSTIGMA_g8510.t1 [Chlamydomonas eustigma]|eukprot:GAX81075.1 hypothetical protein CEUSTIGMA_g8510.t1 [Chlamydomonas eustigma]
MIRNGRNPPPQWYHILQRRVVTTSSTDLTSTSRDYSYPRALVSQQHQAGGHRSERLWVICLTFAITVVLTSITWFYVTSPLRLAGFNGSLFLSTTASLTASVPPYVIDWTSLEASANRQLSIPKCTNTCHKAKDGLCDEGRWPQGWDIYGEIALRQSRTDKSSNHSSRGNNGPEDVAAVSPLVNKGPEQKVECDLGTDCDDCGVYFGRGYGSSWSLEPMTSNEPAGPIADLRGHKREVYARPTRTHPSFMFAYTSDQSDQDVSASMRVQGLVEGGIGKVFQDVLSGRCIGPDGKRKLVLDVGANFGYWTVYAAMHGCRTFLAWNVAVNNVSHLVSVRGNIASSTSGKELRVAVPAAGSDNWGTASVEGSNVNQQSISEWVYATTERVDDVVPASEQVLIMKVLDLVGYWEPHVFHPHYLQVDVEGWEPHVLTGASGLLADKQGYSRAAMKDRHVDVAADVGDAASNVSNKSEPSDFEAQQHPLNNGTLVPGVQLLVSYSASSRSGSGAALGANVAAASTTGGGGVENLVIEYSPHVAEGSPAAMLSKQGLLASSDMLIDLLGLGYRIGMLPDRFAKSFWPPVQPLPVLREVTGINLEYDRRDALTGCVENKHVIMAELRHVPSWAYWFGWHCNKWKPVFSHPKSFRPMFFHNTNLWAHRADLRPPSERSPDFKLGWPVGVLALEEDARNTWVSAVHKQTGLALQRCEHVDPKIQVVNRCPCGNKTICGEEEKLVLQLLTQGIMTQAYETPHFISQIMQ